MQCPSCKETIDDDSFYCIHCGEQILVCSICGRPGMGKRCMFDGKPMVPAETAASLNPTSSPMPVTQASQSAAQVSTPSPAIGDKIKFSSQIHGIIIEAQDGDIIGRTNGAFAGIFGRFNYVSGTHCKLVKTAAGWHIQDLGSTNGTFYNGNKLAPNVPVPLASGTTVTIADLELLITYTGAGTSKL